MQCLFCASFHNRPMPALTYSCTSPSLASPRFTTTSTEMPCGRFFVPMVSLPASSASYRTCARRHRSLCSLVVIWGAIFPSLVVCGRVVWLPLCFLMCSWTSLLRRPLRRHQIVGWKLSSSLEGNLCPPLAQGPCLLPPLLCRCM